MKRDLIEVVFDDGKRLEVKRNTLAHDIMPSVKSEHGLYHIGAIINNEVSRLATKLESDSKVRFVDMKDPQGWRIYRDSVTFLVNTAVNRLYPDCYFTVEHSFGSGVFCRFETCTDSIEDAVVESVEAEMHSLVEAELSISRIKIPFQQAIKEFEAKGQSDKYKLLRFRNPPYIEVHQCDAFYDLAYGVLAPNTRMIAPFNCIPHEGGFIVQFASRENAPAIDRFQHQPNLFKIFQEHKQWGRILGVRTAGDLNEVTADGDIAEFIRTAEALHEKKISKLADQIADNGQNVRWIFLAGPSSSGKTTFAKRIGVQLRLNGIHTSLISVDDFFLDRRDTPLDEEGNYDFENIETVDIDFLHDNLKRLDRGEEVLLPKFNFTKGVRELHEKPFSIGDQEVVIVEGIHGLNPRIWDVLPREHMFKIYVSALTQLNLDLHNRLSTTDNRLLRRIVRDHKFRGNNAIDTLRMWPNVRRGEKQWVFPYQEEADAAFNSALDYEIPVLKLFVEPLLLEVKPYHNVYPAAQRLMNFLTNFLNINASRVPPTSILREFIGKSSFKY